MAIRLRRFKFAGSFARQAASRLTVGVPEDIPFIGGTTIDLGDIFGGGGGGNGPGPLGGSPCSPGFTKITLPNGTQTCVPITGGGGPIVDPAPGFAPTTGDGCLPFMSPDPITGECRFDFDPGAGTGLPGGGDAAGAGLTRPRATSRTVLECPKFADGKTGILWMNALTGDVICLPRRTSGKGFGLTRKNKPRAKPFISAAEKKLLTKMKSTQDRAKKFAQDAGFTCKKK